MPVWGYLPWNDGLVLPERHLGLVPVGEDTAFQRVCAALGSAAERTIDISAVIAAAQLAPALEVPADDVPVRCSDDGMHRRGAGCRL